MKILLTIRETEKAVSMSASKISRLISEKRFPYPVRIGGNVRWRQKDLDQWANDLSCGNIPYSSKKCGRPRLVAGFTSEMNEDYQSAPIERRIIHD